ncbi:mycofactocin biosynthesis glycosyltransferase MftF [Streptomyces sp. NL15-2K]|uniref:mycofactocin biosynthesis glycosyltransferase MftF n=1 Tax=Streptomyces sp. NL15-2K TaxID=376149 RepID=UPI000FFA08C0|nr:MULTISPECIES: mycofactocin biosynthesis glycosyltransferase MftF [Actinomycetes]WKX14712.1 mycofactocin biosynthesis glycosyltransferase MftF [Kutzneria buriramensis]GCB44142.1 mycofactocin system glycosyltransferase [Streptomyces sp. NL15-2K]
MTLPHGFTLTLDRDTRVLDHGRALLGGHPTRLLRLTPRARGLLSGRTLTVRNAAGAVLAERLLATGLAHPELAALPEPATASGTEPTCTYVIPVRDRPRQLARLLCCVPGGSPVLVVDDASRNPELTASVAARHGARLLPLPENLGPAGARNAGLREVTTPHVAFVDSDIVLPAETVPGLLRHFADPSVAMAVPRITALSTAESTGWISRYERTRSSLDLGTRPAAVRPGTPVSWAPSACVVARTDVLLKAGGFDERMRVGEDVDLCWRLVDGGRRIRYEPSLWAAHEHRAGLADWLRRKAEYGTGAHPLAVRHPIAIAPAVLAPWSAGLLLALAVQRRWSLPVAGSLWALTTVRIARTLSDTGQPVRQAVRLTAVGAVSALAQGGSLATRHWWPLTAGGCLVSRRVRRVAAVAAVLDVALEYRRRPTGLDPVRYATARRLDDLAYGAGVWWSALKGHSAAALRPRIVTGRDQRPPGRRLLPGARRLLLLIGSHGACPGRTSPAARTWTCA